MPKRLLTAVVVGAIASFVLAACGSSDDTSTAATEVPTNAEATTTNDDGTNASANGGGGGTVTIEADPSGALAFTQTKVDAPAGSDTIEFSNSSSTGHNVEIEDSSGEDVAGTDTITDGKTSTTADLQPGTYTFYCGVPGHRDAGMEGTITVK
jgi:plastocyanin